MGRNRHVLLKILAGIVVLVVLVGTSVEIVLKTDVSKKVVDRLASRYLDGELHYSRLYVSLFRNFPDVTLQLDSLTLTYDHDKFAAFDLEESSRMLRAGRGELVDTLASFGRLDLAVNPWSLLDGSFRVSKVGLNRLRLYAHSYNDTAANWMLFHFPEKEKKDTVEKDGGPMRIAVREVKIDGRPRIVYTDQKNSVMASVRFVSLGLAGAVRIDSADFNIRRVRLDIDSLRVQGRIPDDTLMLNMDCLHLRERRDNSFDILLSAATRARTKSFGRLEVPLKIDANVGLEKEDAPKVVLSRFDANLAYVPMKLSGYAKIYSDSVRLDADLNVNRCPLDTVLAKYGPAFLPMARDMYTDARLSVDARARGLITKTLLPKVTASVKIPACRFEYLPLDVRSSLEMDAQVSMSSRKVLDVNLNGLKVQMDGLSLDADGTASNLLGTKQAIKAAACVCADLEALEKYVPEELGLKAYGDMDLDVNADFILGELLKGRFENADIRGKLIGNHIGVDLPADTLKVDLYNPDIRLSSSSRGLMARTLMDSVFFVLGSDMKARVRNMENRARLSYVEKKDRLVPRISATTSNSSTYFKTGDTQIMARGLDLAGSVEQRVRSNAERRSRMLDSLQAKYPDVARRDLVSEFRKRNGNAEVPSYLQEKDFRKGDLRIQLDSSLRSLIGKWDVSADVGLTRASVATPLFPLRTRVNGLKLTFDGDRFNIDTLDATCGTSDVSLEGSVSGIRRTLLGRGAIKTNLDLYSNRLNLNEIIAVLQQMPGKKKADSVDYDEDISFVVDSLDLAQIDTAAQMSLVIVPANLTADLNVYVDNVDYLDYRFKPVMTSVKIGERMVQVNDTKLRTDFGNAELDAFYSTRTKKDISAGVDLRLADISAERIIHLMPAVDSLMPALKSFKGNLDCRVSATTQLDTNMNVLMPTLSGMAHISGSKLRIEDAGELRKITSLLLFRNKNIGDIDNMSVDAVVSDSRIEVFPFVLGVDRYTLALSGVQGFDKSLFYHASVLKSPLLFKFGINLTGSLDDIKFSLGQPNYNNRNVSVYSQSLDTLQINLASSISNALSKGADEVRKYNDRMVENIDRSNLATEANTELLTDSQFAQLDSLKFAVESEEASSEVDAEVAEALEYIAPDIEVLDADLDAMIEDKALANRIARMRKRQEKENARAAKMAERLANRAKQ